MATTVAFDVYETLIDTSGVISALEKIIGGQAAPLSPSLAPETAGILLPPGADAELPALFCVHAPGPGLRL